MPDVKGYKLPNHDETYMYADAFARRFTPINAKEFESHNDVMNIMTNGNLDSGNMWDSHIATEDASTLYNSPVISGPFYATRHVNVIPNGNKYYTIVTLHEAYPVDGRIWTRTYDGTDWTPSWQSSFDFAPKGYGLGGTASDGEALADANTATKSGWYKLSSTAANGIGSNCVIRVDAYSENNCFQTAYLLSS